MASPTMYPAILTAVDGITPVIVQDINGYNAAIANGATYGTVLTATQISSAGGQTVTVTQLPLTAAQTFTPFSEDPGNDTP